MVLTFDLIYASLKAENAALREAYTEQQALILQLVERLERTDKISGYPNNREAIKAGRARLEGKP